MKERLRLALVRRGYSPTGGAEAYLKRLARGVIEAGHKVQLIATNEWPEDQWPLGPITRLRAASVVGFADELEQIRPQLDCDALLSLERVWSCDVYRAGDGVHRAWLARRRKFELPLKQFARALNRKHRDLLHLEESLFANRKAARVIVASQMVKNEIIDLYGYPADIFILPTIYDPLSNACLEALACGLPVITTGSNGFSEIIEDAVHGSIVNHAGNLVGLRDAIRFWSDPSRRAAARSANIERASQFDISRNVEQTLEILTDVASR